MKYAVVRTDGHIGYIANGKPVGLPDCYAGAIPLAEESDPEPMFLSRSVPCANCGNSAEDELGNIKIIEVEFLRLALCRDCAAIARLHRGHGHRYFQTHHDKGFVAALTEKREWNSACPMCHAKVGERHTRNCDRCGTVGKSEGVDADRSVYP